MVVSEFKNLHYCAECVRFNTHKCTQRHRLVSIRKNVKTINTWEEWLDWVYDLTQNPFEAYKSEPCLVFKTDVACADFIPFW